MPDRIRLSGRLGELGIIVLGVAIALAGDSWRQGLIERREGDTYAERLALEMSETLEALERERERFALVLEGTLELAEVLRTLTPTTEDRSIALFYVVSATANRREALGPDVTLRELVASGRLGILREPEVRLAVVDFYEQVDWLAESLGSVDQLFRPRFVRLTGCIAARCETRLSREDRAQVVAGAEPSPEFVNGLLAPELRARLRRQMGDPDFADDLREQTMLLDGAARRFDRAIESGEALLAQLR